MTKADFSEFCKTIQAAYPRDAFIESQTQYDLWWDMFKDCNYDFLKLAAKQYIKENRYLPSVSDISIRYNAVKSEMLQRKARLKEIYYYTRNIYPQIYRGNTDAESVFWEIIKSNTYGECLAKAETVRDKTEGYVRRMSYEGAGAEKWLTLAECMTEALNVRD